MLRTVQYRQRKWAPENVKCAFWSEKIFFWLARVNRMNNYYVPTTSVVEHGKKMEAISHHEKSVSSSTKGTQSTRIEERNPSNDETVAWSWKVSQGPRSIDQSIEHASIQHIHQSFKSSLMAHPSIHSFVHQLVHQIILSFNFTSI